MVNPMLLVSNNPEDKMDIYNMASLIKKDPAFFVRGLYHLHFSFPYIHSLTGL